MIGGGEVRQVEEIGRGRPPRTPLSPLAEEAKKTAAVGMLIALGSWTMLFVSLFFAYAAYRLRAPVWPPEGAPALPRLLPGLAALVLLSSCAALHFALGAATKRARLRRLLSALALGALFLALGTAFWRPLWLGGFTAASGIYGSTVWALTGLHALHVAGGLVALAALLPLAGRPAFASRGRVTAMYWDFIAAVGLLTFATVVLL